MNKKSRITLVTTLLVLIVLTASTMNDFFDRLQNERVVSDSTIIWEQVGPGNAGFANLLRYHPTIPGRVATCPDMWNAYQSDDNGGDWFGITDHDGDADFYHLRDLYYSPSNPVQHSFSVLGATENSVIQIFTINGLEVLKTQNTQYIEVSHLMAGNYVVHVTSDNNVEVLKMIKENAL